MTQSMTRWALAGCMALAAMGAVAVLDAGSAMAKPSTTASPFVGTYVGRVPWTNLYYWTITISERGQISSSYSGPGRIKGSISGAIAADGTFSFTVSETYNAYDGERSGRWETAKTDYAGTMSLDADGNAVVPFGAWGTAVWLRQ